MSEKELGSEKNGEKTAFEELLGRYEPLILSEVTKVIAKCPDLSGEAEEMRQEGRLALFDARASFTEGEGVTFGLYAKVCVHNRLISYLRKFLSRKRREERAAAAELTEKGASAAEELAVAYEESERLRRFVSSSLTALEQKVLLLYIEKKSYKEIAEMLGRDEKAVDNAFRFEWTYGKRSCKRNSFRERFGFVES